MGKETVICVIAFILIIVGNNVTNLYAKSEMGEISEQLNELREILYENNVDLMMAKNKIDEVFKNWKQKYGKLAYFIEHNELEKVEVGLTETKGNIEVEEYKEAIVKLNYSDYIITHIEDKLDLNLENIF